MTNTPMTVKRGRGETQGHGKVADGALRHRRLLSQFRRIAFPGTQGLGTPIARSALWCSSPVA